MTDNPVEVAKQRPEYQQALVAMQALTPHQRVYLDCLLDTELEPDAARKLMRKRHGIRIRRAEQDAWLQGDENFYMALAALQQFACSAVAISKAGVLAKLNKLANDCRRLVPYTDKAGNKFMRPVDASAAHAAMVSLAKITGSLQTEGRGGTTINANGPVTFRYEIVSSDGKSGSIIEGSATEVSSDDENTTP